MAGRRRTFEEIGGVVAEIYRGDHDDKLEYIRQACAARLHNRFRPGARMKLTGTRSVELDGQECVILKVNQTSITVGVGEKNQFGYEKEYNVPAAMLEPLS